MRILVIEDEEDLRDLICFTLESQFTAQVSQAASGNDAIRTIESSPPFDCIVSDYAMPNGTGEDVYRYLLSKSLKTPFILVSAYAADSYPIFREYPIAGFVAKPDIFKPLKKIIESLNLGKSLQGDGYCKVKTSVILKYGLLSQDLYIRLSEGKFVKIFRKGDVFDISDFERFKSKTVEHLYLKSSDCDAFLSSLTANLTKVLESDPLPEDALLIAGASVEVIQEVNSRLGFTPQAHELTKVSVSLALKSIVRDLERHRPFDIEMPKSQSYIATHSVAVAHVSCGIASLLGWTSGPTFLKLSFAAFLHDISMTNPDMAKLQNADELMLQRHRFTEKEVKEFMVHCETGAKLVKELKDMPPDVDLIILQHHDKPDGTGMSQLDHTKINPLAAVFIVAHELVDFYAGHGAGADLSLFVNRLGDSYSKGNFKVIIKAITNSLVNTAVAS
ncbi:MAG: response regulator [Deltaproteobacteria bacterium]|nr:response regulator [Deltaproteobacteria bacterium]